MRLKTISLTFALWLCLVSSASADWIPTFDPNQHVYIDPALVSNPNAPITFEKSLTAKLSKYKQANYYLVAIESDQHPQGSLGVAKTDDIIKAWGSLDNFPNKDYALIVWARQKENPAKGGFGVNLSADLIASKELDIKHILKKNMPSNPQGAFLSIVSSIEGSINFAYWGISIALGIVITSLIWIVDLVFGVYNAIRLRFTRKQRAKAELLKQKEYAEKLNQRLLSLDKEDLLGYYLKSEPSNNSVIKANRDYYYIAVLVKSFNSVITVATTLLEHKDYLGVINILSDDVTVDFSQGDEVDNITTFNVNRLEYTISLRMTVFQEQIKTIDQAKENIKYPKVTTPPPAPTTVRTSTPIPTVREVNVKYRSDKENKPKENKSTNTNVYIDNSNYNQDYWSNSNNSSSKSYTLTSSNTDSSSSSSSSRGSSGRNSSSSSSDWGSSGSDYSDSGSSGGDY